MYRPWINEVKGYEIQTPIFFQPTLGNSFTLAFTATGPLSSLLYSLTVCQLIVLSIPMETKRVKPILQEALGRIALS